MYIPFAVLPIVAAALAASIGARSTFECVTTHSGFLSANVQGTLKSFTTLVDGKVGYTGDGQNALDVEFQVCGPDQSSAGRLYVPSTGKCVSVSNQASTTEPYYPVVADCVLEGSAELPSYAQRWADGTIDGNYIVRWSGMTDEEGTTPQGGCGQFGYEANSAGVPTLTTSGQVILECYDHSTPFQLASAAT